MKARVYVLLAAVLDSKQTCVRAGGGVGEK